MCNVCGCGDRAHLPDAARQVQSENAHVDSHLHFGNNPAGVSIAGLDSHKILDLQASVFDSNRQFAGQVREIFQTKNSLALNFLSSPGSGKTTLIVNTLAQLLPQFLPTRRCLVIEGDQQTSRDAERIAATGVTSMQINTGKGCHLDAHMVLHALERCELDENSLVLIENVGNLVCPAEFDLGEHSKIVALSVTEGEDKPLKYPDIFYHSQLLIITKTDLAPYVEFDIDACCRHAKSINPEIDILTLSAKTGAGMPAWLQWLQTKMPW